MKITIDDCNRFTALIAAAWSVEPNIGYPNALLLAIGDVEDWELREAAVEMIRHESKASKMPKPGVVMEYIADRRDRESKNKLAAWKQEHANDPEPVAQMPIGSMQRQQQLDSVARWRASEAYLTDTPRGYRRHIDEWAAARGLDQLTDNRKAA